MKYAFGLMALVVLSLVTAPMIEEGLQAGDRRAVRVSVDVDEYDGSSCSGTKIPAPEVQSSCSGATYAVKAKRVKEPRQKRRARIEVETGSSCDSGYQYSAPAPVYEVAPPATEVAPAPPPEPAAVRSLKKAPIASYAL